MEQIKYIYANHIIDGKYYKTKLKIVEMKEISEKEYYNKKEICDNYKNGEGEDECKIFVKSDTKRS